MGFYEKLCSRTTSTYVRWLQALTYILARYTGRVSLTIMVTRSMLMEMLRATFVTPKEAARWWRTPHTMMQGRSPAATARSQQGKELVRDILVSLRFGGVV